MVNSLRARARSLCCTIMLSRELHPTPICWWCPCSACFRWSGDVASSPRQVGAGDDVAPTSLNEGRGEVVVPAFVFVFLFHLAGGWMAP